MISIKSWCLCGAVALSGMIAVADEPHSQPDAGPFVRALWAVQRYGTLEAADPRHDERTKAHLAAALAKNGGLTHLAVKSKLMDEGLYQALARTSELVRPSIMQAALDANMPDARRRLLPAVAAHLDLLMTSFDRIDAVHLAAGEQLAEWIVNNYQPAHELPVIFVCSGNSRRSILGATMGNVAASYWGLPEVRFYSGGTAPSAFNRRTIAALQSIGIEVETTGEEAKRGLEGLPNPMYSVRWGETTDNATPAMETIEFSKHYNDASNPKNGFAAIMVCSQADIECPVVKGASRRISMPYLDPKTFDDSEYEALKYAERRDDLGRLLLAVMLKARRQLESTEKIAPPAIDRAAVNDATE